MHINEHPKRTLEFYSRLGLHLFSRAFAMELLLFWKIWVLWLFLYLSPLQGGEF